MPAPHETSIPKHEFWNFIKRHCDNESQLIPLARNIGSYDNHMVNDNIENILSFDTSQVRYWSNYWTTIIHTLGIGNIVKIDGSSVIYKTALTDYINSGQPLDSFFYYWALKFQFPFRQKDTYFYKQKISIQPMVSILEHLVCLFEKGKALNKNQLEYAYLTIEEFILVVMKSKNNTITEVKKNVNKIVSNRDENYDYSDLKVIGYTSKMKEFTYIQHYLGKFNLIKFSNDKSIFIESWEHYYKILTFLSFRVEPFIMEKYKDFDKFVNKTFNNLKPNPLKLLEVVNSVKNTAVEENLTSTINNYIFEKGINFERDFIEAFLLSLKTKPFIILSGISGVGKSLLPRMIMQLTGNRNCNPIAVAPDWTDNTDMLGYFNVDDEFIVGEFTNLILEANENSHMPYFIILDEMNLSRVEYYFAQVLSVIESRYFDENVNKVKCYDFLFNKGTRNKLLFMSKSESELDKKINLEKLSELKIPNNVYIIGTVNVDESTYPFSKKVLDRANILEINEVNLMIGIENLDDEESDEATSLEKETLSKEEKECEIENNIEEETQKSSGGETGNSYTEGCFINHFFAGKITNMKELQNEWKLNIELGLPMKKTLVTWVKELEEFNLILQKIRMNFGYRVRDEVCIYIYHAANFNLDETNNQNWWHKYFDQQLVQKVLTRFGGEQGEIEYALVDLFNLCIDNKENYDEENILNKFEDIKNIKFPKAADKLRKMLIELSQLNKPSTSFWSV